MKILTEHIKTAMASLFIPIGLLALGAYRVSVAPKPPSAPNSATAAAPPLLAPAHPPVSIPQAPPAAATTTAPRKRRKKTAVVDTGAPLPFSYGAGGVLNLDPPILVRGIQHSALSIGTLNWLRAKSLENAKIARRSRSKHFLNANEYIPTVI